MNFEATNLIVCHPPFETICYLCRAIGQVPKLLGTEVLSILPGLRHTSVSALTTLLLRFPCLCSFYLLFLYPGRFPPSLFLDLCFSHSKLSPGTCLKLHFVWKTYLKTWTGTEHAHESLSEMVNLSAWLALRALLRLSGWMFSGGLLPYVSPMNVKPMSDV